MSSVDDRSEMVEERKPRVTWKLVASCTAGTGFLMFVASLFLAVVPWLFNLLREYAWLLSNPLFCLGATGFVLWMLGCVIWHLSDRNKEKK